MDDYEEEEDIKEEDDPTKAVASKIKSQFANFSVLSLLARKTPDKEERGEKEGGEEAGRGAEQPSLAVPKEEAGCEASRDEEGSQGRPFFPFLFPPLRGLYPQAGAWTDIR